MPALSAGTVAPPFALKTMDGGTFSLEEARQRGPVVAAFFKVTCPVVQFAFPFLERLYQHFRGKNLAFVGISQHSQADTAAFMREFGVTFPVALDDPQRYQVSNAYGLTNVPTVFYLDTDGEIELSMVGWARSDIEQLNRKLAQHAKTQPAPLFRAGEDIPDFRPG